MHFIYQMPVIAQGILHVLYQNRLADWYNAYLTYLG